MSRRAQPRSIFSSFMLAARSLFTWSMDVSQASTPMKPFGTIHLTFSAVWAILSTASSMSPTKRAVSTIILTLRLVATFTVRSAASSGVIPVDMSMKNWYSQPRLGSTM